MLLQLVRPLAVVVADLGGMCRGSQSNYFEIISPQQFVALQVAYRVSAGLVNPTVARGA
jgi:hypothetical protein